MVLKKLKLKLASALSDFMAEDGESSVEITGINARHLTKGMGVALLSGILGTSPGVFACYPFGLAYLCASDKFIPFSYIGLMVSAIANRSYAVPAAVLYTVTVMLRYALSKLLCEAPAADTHSAKGRRKPPVLERMKQTLISGSQTELFRESLLIRCSVACFAAFVFGLYRLVAGGFLYYDLFGLLAGFMITPVSCFALSGLFVKNAKLPRAVELSAATLMFMTVYSLRGHTIFGFSLSFMAAFFVTLWAASCTGGLKGCAIGLLSGLACGSINILSSSGSYELTYTLGAAPCIMAVVGLCAGALWKISRPAALTCACTLGITLGLAIDGYGVLSRIIPDVISTTAIFAPLTHFAILPRIPVFVSPDSSRTDDSAVVLEKKQTDTLERISALSDAFSHLSDTVYALSDRMRRPGVADLKQVCDNSFDSYCGKCSLSALCWEKECGSTLDALSKITAKLYAEGRVSVNDVPEYLKGRCYNIMGIVDEINISCGKLIEKLIKTDKTAAFALDYEAMSKLLSEQIATNDAEYRIDDDLTDKLRQTVKHLNLCPSRAICYGSRKKHIVIEGVDLAGIKHNSDEIRTAMENTVGHLLDNPSFGIDGDKVTVTLDARRRFFAEVAKASSIKENEKANGDSAVTFDNREDFFYALVSDGMGSGREAAITSKICAVFLERMLRAGNSKAVTLEMLNGFIRSRGTECSATVDLAEIDLITGDACFVKSGAAPSFVLRSGNLYKLQSKTVPIGIMPQIDAEKIKFELMPGDIIIMISDGVAQSLEDGVWLANLLTYEWEDDLSAMAEKILDNACLNNKRSDDMTAALIRISESTAQ